MARLRHRRHDKPYELLLLSPFFLVVIGWVLTVALPSFAYWGSDVFLNPNNGQKQALIVSSSALVIANFSISRIMARFPGARSVGLVVPQVVAIYLLAALIPLIFHTEVSRFLLGFSALMAILWFQIEIILTERYRRPKLAVVDTGHAGELLSLRHVDARALTEPDLQGVRYDAVVADFECLTPEWERFLAQCALNRIPVHNALSVYESVTGRVRINRMSENDLGSLLPSRLYGLTKIVMDWSLILASLPVTLLIVAVAALLIKLESPGPAFFTQTRIGRGNRPFTIYKLRSMRFDQNASTQFAGEEDPRITRIGRVIRKYRIDELPQFFNVLKGDMSLIGPRPEQPAFVQYFDQELPFYVYRHVVKPGITGWAQVLHGYADNVDQTREKIEHDFYYIKHCSLFLDIFILLLTIRTMCTGFGAR
ncbi:exopolysaccharide biosynthesis polyprenyl glycosylphosphotransferase [Pollutimonas harenae]|uniref:Exopolysaccharide biosynthesis polyprenyl glycosylphosphotransferase n=1 Tax=Pollutimonas harenae TaxID=657015 RepID=A0A853GY95_9BURK|nr:exopolysaccharide biosynthesis polyprenyl glycosylphosphotransferase [Pollutimonas harenae]NYT84349.1 exopolysaccharide biosynthesis polyprenyl glycosylphosphotransferase [Pollutimonas harenae]TEA73250.1 exopolysaccharide biosynthesis polyprenyl glycosylphosphotransferase [Pollutimonas harenae]